MIPLRILLMLARKHPRILDALHLWKRGTDPTKSFNLRDPKYWATGVAGGMVASKFKESPVETQEDPNWLEKYRQQAEDREFDQQRAEAKLAREQQEAIEYYKHKERWNPRGNTESQRRSNYR